MKLSFCSFLLSVKFTFSSRVQLPLLIYLHVVYYSMHHYISNFHKFSISVQKHHHCPLAIYVAFTYKNCKVYFLYHFKLRFQLSFVLPCIVSVCCMHNIHCTFTKFEYVNKRIPSYIFKMSDLSSVKYLAIVSKSLCSILCY